MDELLKYFPALTNRQREQFEQFLPLYQAWNEKINVISRKDVDSLYLHHVLHSLALLKWLTFKPGSKVLDLGTGGGFPGLPLAVMMPEVSFHLVDSINKKLTVVDAVSVQLGLENVTTTHTRAEELKTRYDFVITRAVAPLTELVRWSRKLLEKQHRNILPNGIIAWKGGAIRQEINELQRGEYTEVRPISDWFKSPFFEEKYLVYVQG